MHLGKNTIIKGKTLTKIYVWIFHIKQIMIHIKITRKYRMLLFKNFVKVKESDPNQPLLAWTVSIYNNW